MDTMYIIKPKLPCKCLVSDQVQVQIQVLLYIWFSEILLIVYRFPSPLKISFRRCS